LFLRKYPRGAPIRLGLGRAVWIGCLEPAAGFFQAPFYGVENLSARQIGHGVASSIAAHRAASWITKSTVAVLSAIRVRARSELS